MGKWEVPVHVFICVSMMQLAPNYAHEMGENGAHRSRKQMALCFFVPQFCHGFFIAILVKLLAFITKINGMSFWPLALHAQFRALCCLSLENGHETNMASTVVFATILPSHGSVMHAHFRWLTIHWVWIIIKGWHVIMSQMRQVQKIRCLETPKYQLRTFQNLSITSIFI